MADAGWFGPGDADALRDFFEVYTATIQMDEVVRLASLEDPTYAAATRLLATLWTSDRIARKREILRNAIAGDWAPYETELRREATQYAENGVRDWQVLATIIARLVTPELVSRYEMDPRRLAAALLVMHEFLVRVRTTIGVAYVARREAMIQEVEQRSKRLLESSMIGVFTVDAEGRTTFVNERLAAILGVTKAEALTMSLASVLVDRLPQVDTARRRARMRGEIGRYEQAFRRKDGSTGWAFVESTPLFDLEGRFEGVTALVLDITEQKTADEALRKSEARFRRLAEAGLLGISVTDDRARILYVNAAAATLLGYTPEELAAFGPGWHGLTPPEWAESDQAMGAELMTHGVAKPREKELLHKEGHRVPVLVASARLEGNEYIGCILDLTPQKNAEAAIERLRGEHATNAEFRALLEAAPDAMVISDRDEAITLVNRQAEALFGYTRSELLGMPVTDLIPGSPEHDGGRSLGRDPSSHVELFGRQKGGQRFPIEVSTSPIETERGLLVSRAIRDISERRQIETELRAANAELESFSYSVAHDLRAPLRGMNGFAKILLEDYGDRLDAEGVGYLRHISNNALRMAELIDALLSLARVSRSELRKRRTDLSSVARAIFAELSQDDPRVVDVVVEDGLVVDADPALLRTLLDNLLGNAWKFTRHTERAKIEVGRADSFFFVRDNGAGFDMAHADKLFAPFQRLHAATEFPGTGIGLATARRILERHGGLIWAEGTRGGGATFRFTLGDGTAPRPDVPRPREGA